MTGTRSISSPSWIRSPTNTSRPKIFDRSTSSNGSILTRLGVRATNAAASLRSCVRSDGRRSSATSTSRPCVTSKSPRPSARDNPVSPKDFTAIIAEVKDQPFRDLLQFAWESGVRPFELRTIDIRHLCLERRRIEISPDEAKGKKRWRTIRLTDTAIEIVRRRKGNRKAGRLFLNTDGNPWKNYAICNRFARLKKKLGKRWAAYDIRHGFCENGVDHLTVAELMGHANGQMVATTYSHLNRADQHLHEQLERSAK